MFHLESSYLAGLLTPSQWQQMSAKSLPFLRCTRWPEKQCRKAAIQSRRGIAKRKSHAASQAWVNRLHAQAGVRYAVCAACQHQVHAMRFRVENCEDGASGARLVGCDALRVDDLLAQADGLRSAPGVRQQRVRAVARSGPQRALALLAGLGVAVDVVARGLDLRRATSRWSLQLCLNMT